MADEWKEGFSEKHQKKFWKNKATGESTWKDPTQGAKKGKADDAASSASSTVATSNPEWVETFSEKHQKKVWKNSTTGKSTFKDPYGGSSSVASAPAPAAQTTAAATGDDSGEWEEKFSKEKNKKYWKNKVTGKSSWTPPAGTGDASKPAATASAPAVETAVAADSDWEEKFSKEKNKKYWKNKVTGKSSWTPPPTATAATSAAPAAAAGETAASDDWEEKFSKEKNKKYWKNKVTGKSTWVDPHQEAKKTGDDISVVSALTTATNAAAASEWEEKFSKEKNKKFWKNKVTGKSTWTQPPELSAPAKTAATPAASASPAVLSDEWEEKFSKEKNKKYWKNKVTGKSTWTDPAKEAKKEGDDVSVITTVTVATAAHASEWEEKFSKEKNKKYWKNKVTGKASWTPPPDAGAAPAAADAVAAGGAAATVESEWEEKFSKEKNKKYWKSKVTGKSTWTQPPAPTASATAAAGAVSVAGAPTASGAATPVQALSRAASVVKVGVLKGVVGFASTTAPSESLLVAPARTALSRKLIQLRGKQAATELDVLEFTEEFAKSRRISAQSAVAESSARVLHTYKLMGLKSIICNESAGQISIVLPAGALVEEVAAPPRAPTPAPVPTVEGAVAAAGDTPAADGATVTPASLAAFPAAVESKPQVCAYLLLNFQNSSVAQRWFQALLSRLDLAENKTGDQSQAVVSDLTNSDMTLPEQGEEDLLGCYSFAGLDSALLRMEAEWLLLASANFAGATDLQAALKDASTSSHSLSTAAVALTALPSTGLLLFKVLAVHDVPADEAPESPWAPGANLLPGMDSSASQSKGWMSCWVRVDRAARAIVFYDQGPGSAPSLSVSCEFATLHIPDLTDSSLGCECNLYHCDVLNSPAKAKMSLAIKLPNAEELFKWALTFAALLESVTYCSGGIVNAATQAIDYLQDSQLLPLSAPQLVSLSDFPGTKPFLAEICLGVLEGLAERRMCSSYIRNVRLNGAQIKSARFLQMNQRIVLLMKGTCSSLTEGSVLLSVNGLSTVSTPASTILKFIADFPRQMLGELTLWKFPRMEFRVDVVTLSTSSSTDSANTASETGLRRVNEGLAGLNLAPVDDSSKMTPKSKLNKVMLQKRNSILKINSGLDMSFEGIAYPNILAGLQSEMKSEENAAASASTAAAVNGDAAVNVEKAPVEVNFSLSDFTRAAAATDIKWQQCRFMVASGNISMLVSGDCGADVLLCRLQLSSCQLKLVYPAYGSAVDHLCIHLSDSKAQVAIRCPSLAVFIDLTECLLIALKMMGSFPADLAHLYDQSVHWRTSEERGGAAKAANGQSLLMQSVQESADITRGGSLAGGASSLMSPLRTPMTPTNTIRSFEEETEPLAKAQAAAPDSSILQAAEELENTLSSLHLPLNFPTHTVVEKELVELFKLNNANHRLLAEFLTLQFEVTHPIPETAETRETRKKSMSYAAAAGPAAEEDKPVPTENKYPSMSTTPTREYDYERNTEESEPAPAKDLDTVLRDKLMTALLASNENKEEKDGEDEDGEQRKSEESRQTTNTEDDTAEMTVVPRITPPSPKESVVPVRRASVQMRSGSVLMGSVVPVFTQQSTANRRATFRKSAITHSQEQMAVLLMSQVEKQLVLQGILNKGDRAAISVLLNYLRNSPQDLVNIAVRFTSPTDVAGLAHFVVHRLCVYWSAEQRMLEEVVYTAALAEAPQHGRSFNDALNNASDSTKTSLLFSSQSLLNRLSSTTNASGGSFLQAVLNEITSRLDVVVYIQSLCDGISVESLTQDSGVADLCARVVEPFCRRFEAAVVSGAMPIVLKHTLKALVRCETTPIKPLDFISDSILPHILNTILAKNKHAESLNRPTLTDEQVQVILDRVRDLVNLCFSQDVARHLKICLSDQAALSRSKWYIEKSLQYIIQESRGGANTSTGVVLNGKEPKSSPIAKLAQIEASSGKTSAVHSMVCVRPSELFFILQSMELSNISAAPLSAYSKELSQAITHMHTSDLLQRLHSELRLTPVPATSSSNQKNSEHSTGILDAMRESGVPALDRELTFLLHITPHKIYHAEFMQHFNDDSSATQAMPKGLSGLPSSSTASLLPEADLLSPLLTSESVEESPEAHSLASIRWLVQASRSALKAMYEHNSSSISKNHSAVRELQELRGKLLARSDEIAGILADWKKISVCMEVCSNFKAQIGLLLEKYKYHKKLSQQTNQSAVYWNASGVNSSGADNDAAISTASLLEASATLASAAAQKDAEVQETLSKIVLLQLKLEGELQRISYPAESQGLFAPKSQSASDQDSTPGPVRSASKLAALAANSPLAARNRSTENGASFFGKSPSWAANPSSRGDDYISGSMRRAPNPLHVVMQSVFASSNPSTPQKL